MITWYEFMKIIIGSAAVIGLCVLYVEMCG